MKPKPLPLSLKPALRRYWPFLIGAASFSTVSGIYNEFVHPSLETASIPEGVLFLLAILPIQWLVMTAKVRYSFWIFTGVVFVASAIPGIAIVQLAKSLFA